MQKARIIRLGFERMPEGMPEVQDAPAIFFLLVA